MTVQNHLKSLRKILNIACVDFFVSLERSFSFVRIRTNSSTSFKIVGAALNSISSFDQYSVLTTTFVGDWFENMEKDDDVFGLFLCGLCCFQFGNLYVFY